MNATAHSTDLDLPAPESLARGDFDIVIRRLADDLAFGSDTSRLVGSGLEYASSRPYIPGDSVRLLNWRLTARTGWGDPEVPPAAATVSVTSGGWSKRSPIRCRARS